MKDILMLLHHKEITLEEADSIMDELMENIHRGKAPPDWITGLGFTNYEATASAHGASISDLLKLRYEGWPTTCSKCGRTLNYKDYGWWFFRGEDGTPRLRHIECPVE